jgi:hypothetical protein
MVYEDNFATGFVLLFILMAMVPVLIGLIELIPIYLIIRKTSNRTFQLGIPAIVLLLGFLLMMQFETPLFVISSLVVVGPLAVLIPPYMVPRLTLPESRFIDIIISFVAVTVVDISLLFNIFFSETAMFKESIWHAPFSNVLIYAGIILLDTGVAFVVYLFMMVFRSGQRAADEKVV